MGTAHVDTFARDNLPPRELQPEYLFDLPELAFPAQLNCATELLDRRVAEGGGRASCLRSPEGTHWTYADLLAHANRIANVLQREMGVVPGNRVLLRAPNNPMMAACWFAVVKAGAIAVATMPLLRAKELATVVGKAKVTHALCDARLGQDLRDAAAQAPSLASIKYFNDASAGGLEAAMARQPDTFDNVDTAADDTCILAFTSGTTGVPKATMHFHRDVMAACKCFPPHILRARADDVFTGSPPLAFTFGLGGLLLFPLSIGASTLLIERATPDALLDAVKSHGATVMVIAPTSYRALAAHGPEIRASKLRKCISAGEVLPATTRKLWKDATGIEIIDGIGSTELLHIFISADEAHARPGATGKAIPGYVARVVDDEGRTLPPNTVGRLAVKGPTGCRYLADERQASYVRDGWNYTGDAYLVDDDGYFHYQSRTDDMIVSAGYNIGAPEVEDALLSHPKVAECGVIGAPDEQRGQIVKAFVVLKPGHARDEATVRELQDFVKQAIAQYKYPRAVAFLDALPRTETGKLQRFKLRSLD